MMNAVFYSDKPKHIGSVYSAETIKNIKQFCNLNQIVLNKRNLNKNSAISKNAEVLFTTWGMEHYTKEEIKQFFPNLKYIFYAAGSVQNFAKEFIESNVRVFSASDANAIAVAEYTFSQIVLANKGLFQSVRKTKFNHYAGYCYSNSCTGNYRVKIGIIGVGKIGMRVAKLLKNIDCDIFYYDPFLSVEKAEELGITAVSLEKMFNICDCITNHLADKDELANVINYKLFALMKPYAVFINTGRGRQVDEKGLVKAMRECKTRTALLDVTFPEPSHVFSPLRRTKNIILTPHIAGSLGKELMRMGDYMCAECKRIINDERPLYEVTADMLKTMA